MNLHGGDYVPSVMRWFRGNAGTQETRRYVFRHRDTVRRSL